MWVSHQSLHASRKEIRHTTNDHKPRLGVVQGARNNERDFEEGHGWSEHEASPGVSHCQIENQNPWLVSQKWAKTNTLHFDKIYPELCLKQPLICSWVKDEAKWWAAYAAEDGMAHSAKQACKICHPELTEMMDLWVVEACEDGLLLTGGVLHQKWWVFADMVGVPEDEQLALSDGWYSQYKNCIGLKQMKQHGKAGSVKPEVMELEQHWIWELIHQSGFAPQDTFNMDETGLFYVWAVSSRVPNGYSTHKICL